MCESAGQPAPKSWYRHLNSHRILGPAYHTLIEQFRQYELSPVEQLTTPTEVIPPVRDLRILQGFTCRTCGRYRTIDEGRMRDHMSSTHKVKPLRARDSGQYKACLLQTFFSARGRINYFEVQREDKGQPFCEWLCSTNLHNGSSEPYSSIP